MTTEEDHQRRLTYATPHPAPVNVYVGGTGKGGKIIVLAAAFLIVIAGTVATCFWFFTGRSVHGDGIAREATTIRIIKSDPVQILVMQSTQLDIDIKHVEDQGLLLGHRNGRLEVRGTLLYGVDLKTVDAGSIRSLGETVYVRIPDPQIISWSPDMSSERFTPNRAGTVQLRDGMMGRDLRAEMWLRVEDEAKRVAKEKGHLPSREDLVKRLNERADSLFGNQVSWKVRFE